MLYPEGAWVQSLREHGSFPWVKAESVPADNRSPDQKAHRRALTATLREDRGAITNSHFTDEETVSQRK